MGHLEVGISTEAELLIPDRLRHPSLPRETVVSGPESLQRLLENKRPRFPSWGVHYRPPKSTTFFPDSIKIINLIKANPCLGNYISFHFDHLSYWQRSMELRYQLELLDRAAGGTDIRILLENTAHGIERDFEPWVYKLPEAHQTFKKWFREMPRYGYNVDFAHMRLADEASFKLLQREWARLLTDPNTAQEQVFEEKELERLFNLEGVIRNTAIIHWTIAKKGMFKDRATFKLAQAVYPSVPKIIGDKGVQLAVLANNVMNAHYTVASQPDNFSMLLTWLENTGFNGNLVIESPGLLEFLREHRRPFEREVALLHK